MQLSVHTGVHISFSQRIHTVWLHPVVLSAVDSEVHGTCHVGSGGDAELSGEARCKLALHALLLAVVVVHVLAGVLIAAGGTLHRQLLAPLAVAVAGRAAYLMPYTAVLSPCGLAVAVIVAAYTAAEQGRNKRVPA